MPLGLGKGTVRIDALARSPEIFGMIGHGEKVEWHKPLPLFAEVFDGLTLANLKESSGVVRVPKAKASME